MNSWTAAVEFLASLILTVGEVLGDGRVAGILVTTFVVRTALIPILGPLAARTAKRQKVVRRIRPQIRALDQQFKDDPDTLSKRLKVLHEENGIPVVDWAGLGAALVQLPILIALFQAVLVVWEPNALTVMGSVLGVLAGGLSLLATASSGQADGAKWMMWMSGVLPLAICLWLGAGVGLYLTAFYGASVLQSVIMRRGETVQEAAGRE